ncbi:Hypothetical_protein [Hexamita inflata]|uniref:Hypothetical_protein n=1 Tax=Hexamita inflata TaxID=28002 RepID=A0ABP1HPM0_9EUKA
MFLFKPISSLDIFLAIKDGYFIVFNRKMRLIYFQKINYCFSAGQVEILHFVHYRKFHRVYSSIYYQIPTGYLNTVCKFERNVYIVVFDIIFVLRNSGLQFICYIPEFCHDRWDINSKHNHLQLFSFCDKLFVHNSNNKLFELKNNKLTYNNNKHFNIHYFQFCDKLFCLKYNYIYKVQNLKFKLQYIHEIFFVEIIFNGSGIIVFESYHDKDTIIVLNMLDEHVYRFPAPYLDLKNEVVLGKNGFVIKNKKLDEIL